MNLKRWTKWGAVAGVAGAAAALVLRKSQRPNVELESYVSDALVAAFGDDAARIDVRSQGRRVVLRGEVRQLEDIGAYENEARAVVGVNDVDNLLRLGQ